MGRGLAATKTLVSVMHGNHGYVFNEMREYDQLKLLDSQIGQSEWSYLFLNSKSIAMGDRWTRAWPVGSRTPLSLQTVIRRMLKRSTPREGRAPVSGVIFRPAEGRTRKWIGIFGSSAPLSWKNQRMFCCLDGRRLICLVCPYALYAERKRKTSALYMMLCLLIKEIETGFS